MPPSLNELTRLFNGLTLVCKEVAAHNRATSFQNTASDLQNLIKTALISATDLTGLTQGNLRQFSLRESGSGSGSASSSVVYFSQTGAGVADMEDFSVSNSSVSNVGDDKADISVVDSGDIRNVGTDFDNVAPVDVVGGETTVPPVKRRKLRERKVPSTSFSRALGSVFQFRCFSRLLCNY